VFVARLDFQAVSTPLPNLDALFFAFFSSNKAKIDPMTRTIHAPFQVKMAEEVHG
jgi:hypothetical protein